MTRHQMAPELEGTLMVPRYAGFLAAALAISDDFERGLIVDLTGFKAWAHSVAEQIAGQSIEVLTPMVAQDDELPQVIRSALDALINGISLRQRQ